MDKPDDKEDAQWHFKKVGRDDVSHDGKIDEVFISIIWSDDRLRTFDGKPLDHFGHEETLQAGDTVRYTKVMGVAARKEDVETTKIISVHPENEIPLVLSNNEQLTTTSENGDYLNMLVQKFNSKYDVYMQIYEYHLLKSSNDCPDTQQIVQKSGGEMMTIVFDSTKQ
eukprot:13058981-Ditylum_brightwellii.AAC.1